MSRRNFEKLTPSDRELLLDLGRRSVTVMRQQWDATEGKARQTVLAHGVKANAVDMVAFRTAAAPLLQEYLQQPDVAEIYRRIREFT